MNFAATAMEDIPSTAEEWAKNRKMVADRDKRISDWIEKNIGTPRSWLGLDDKRIGSLYGGYDMARRAAYANSPAGVAEAAVNRALADKANHHSTTEAKADDRLVNPYEAVLDRVSHELSVEREKQKADNETSLRSTVANIVYELMKPTRDRLFEEIPVDRSKQQADRTETAAVPHDVNLPATAAEAGRRRQQKERETAPYNPNTPGLSQYFAQPAKPDVDMSAANAAETEAARIGGSILQALSISAMPTINLGQLQQAVSLAQRFVSLMQSAGNLASKGAGSLAGEMRRNFSDYGVKP